MKFENMPEQIARLPLDHRGYPIPWFTWRDGRGVPDLRVADGRLRLTGYRKRLCWVCGDELARELCFVGGAMAVVNRVFADWAMHRECGDFACRACPFINGTMVRRRHEGLPDGAEPLPGGHEDPVVYAALYVTVGDVGLSREGHFLPPPPRFVWWYRGGTRVPEAEALPLVAAARAEIARQLAARRREMPPWPV